MVESMGAPVEVVKEKETRAAEATAEARAAARAAEVRAAERVVATAVAC